jgi:RND family efflux transporter MFP subunit
MPSSLHRTMRTLHRLPAIVALAAALATAAHAAQPPAPGTVPARPAGPARGHVCLIEPFQRVELRSVVEARILAMHVDRGSEVRKGQVLVDLDSAHERAALEGARYRSVMEGEIKGADGRVEAAKEKLARRELMVKERFLAPQDRDDTRSELQVAEANRTQALDNRRLAQIEQTRLAELVEQRRLRSPINGVVTERLQQVGEIAQAGETARAVLRLAQIHPLRVEVVLPVSLYGKVARGAKVMVEAEAPVSGRYEATVQVVDKVVDSASGTFGVRLELPNPGGNIPAGIKCRVAFD